MIARARLWFFALSQREQWGVGLAGVLALAVLLWAGIVRPLADALESARVRQADAVARLGATRATIAALSALRQQHPEQIAQPLEALVRARAAEAGFVLDNVSPQAGGAVQISFPSARPAALFAWLADLEQGGVLVMTLTTRDNGDATLSCDVALKARGA